MKTEIKYDLKRTKEIIDVTDLNMHEFNIYVNGENVATFYSMYQEDMGNFLVRISQHITDITNIYSNN